MAEVAREIGMIGRLRHAALGLNWHHRLALEPLASFVSGVLLSIDIACVEGLGDSTAARRVLTATKAALGGRTGSP